eukprot:TRINITY_DN37398_c0_g1_i1.p1 TRINITY_DN37398_c0_g1~~TRINITY_DN37398_c0_g1_i1.p1  ORF type:complete len:172 (+),score=31.30 TRINITY_DN37398_c0_g1_i1:44-559(+)
MLYIYTVFSSIFIVFFFLVIRRPPRSTHCISSAASDVYKRQGYCHLDFLCLFFFLSLFFFFCHLKLDLKQLSATFSKMLSGNTSQLSSLSMPYAKLSLNYKLEEINSSCTLNFIIQLQYFPIFFCFNQQLKSFWCIKFLFVDDSSIISQILVKEFQLLYETFFLLFTKKSN